MLFRVGWSFLIATTLAVVPLSAQTLMPPFDSDYTLTSLGSITDLPASYGGLTFLAGDPNTMLIGGNANQANAAIYRVGVTRDVNGHITGFSGPAVLFATAPNIDGGLAYGPGGVLFATTYNNNNLLQYLPGAVSPTKIINLTGLGVAASTGTLGFVPAGFAGAGGFRILSFNASTMYSADLTPDGGGTFDVSNVQLLTNTGGGPEGIIWVTPGSPEFPNPSVLISEWSAGEVAAYELDGAGVPIPATRRLFIDNLSGAEGAVLDPVTGDFLFSTFGGGDQVIRVSGFAPIPEPASLLLGGLGLAGAWIGGRRLRRARKTK